MFLYTIIKRKAEKALAAREYVVKEKVRCARKALGHFKVDPDWDLTDPTRNKSMK